jgi:hypothetical protein
MTFDDKIPQSKVGLRLHDGISEYMKPFEGTYKAPAINNSFNSTVGI